jgi:hypothetical protein
VQDHLATFGSRGVKVRHSRWGACALIYPAWWYRAGGCLRRATRPRLRISVAMVFFRYLSRWRCGVGSPFAGLGHRPASLVTVAMRWRDRFAPRQFRRRVGPFDDRGR